MRRPEGRPARVVVSALAMLAVGFAAAWLLAPAAAPDPAPVELADYLPATALAEASDFRSVQRLVGLAALGLELAVLAALALGRPLRARRLLERLEGRPLLGAMAAGGAVAALTAVATLPLRLVAHERAVDFGLSTQSLGAWLGDVGRSAAIAALLTALGALILIGLVRRFEARWWVPGSAVLVALVVAFVWIAPVLLSPVFNDFTELPERSGARADVLELADEAGVEVGEVLSIDASRRVSTLNAYVDGLGPTKRVVLYDNLIAAAEREELRSVVAHELGHVAGDDIPRGIAYVAIVAPFGLLFTRELALALAERTGLGAATPAAVPAYLLGLALATLALGVPGNQLSRAVEERADAFALELTDDPQGLIDLQVRLARANLSDPDPPGWARALFATHPTTAERIGAALAYERSAGR